MREKGRAHGLVHGLAALALLCMLCVLPTVSARASNIFNYTLNKADQFRLDGEIKLNNRASIGLDTYTETKTYTEETGSCTWTVHYFVVFDSAENDYSQVKAEERNNAFCLGVTTEETMIRVPTQEVFTCDNGYFSAPYVWLPKETGKSGIINEGSVPAYVSRVPAEDEEFTWTAYQYITSSGNYIEPIERHTVVKLKCKLRFVSEETADSSSGSSGSGSSTTENTAVQTKKVLKKGSKFSVKDVDGVRYYYKLTGKSTVQLLKMKGKTSILHIYSDVDYQNTYYKVTSIAAKAFKGNKKIKSLYIGQSITTIGADAFSGCTALKEVILGPGVKQIGKNCFKGDKKLKSIIIQSRKLKKSKVGSKAFSGIYAKATVTVPSGYAKKYKSILKAAGLGKKAKVI